jgi:hypothetical protein
VGCRYKGREEVNIIKDVFGIDLFPFSSEPYFFQNKPTRKRSRRMGVREPTQAMMDAGLDKLIEGSVSSLSLTDVRREVWKAMWDAAPVDPDRLVEKANKLVELMDQAETQHGGLVGSVTLRAKNELRLELSKWK